MLDKVTAQQQARQQWQNRVNNAQGHFFEGAIMAACQFYHDRERAEIDKTPEPFRVTSKSRNGTFTGPCTAGLSGHACRWAFYRL